MEPSHGKEAKEEEGREEKRQKRERQRAVLLGSARTFIKVMCAKPCAGSTPGADLLTSLARSKPTPHSGH